MGLIASSTVNLERLTQEAAVGSEQSAAAAQELSAQSEVLGDVVNDLSTLVGA